LDGIQRAKSPCSTRGALKPFQELAQELAAGDFVGGVDYNVHRSGDEALSFSTRHLIRFFLDGF
jgi:hypothetical protein